jgi:RimJ/RimL family protein N-acetyltransferase
MLRAHSREDMETANRFLNEYDLQQLKSKEAIFPQSIDEVENFFLNAFSKNRALQYAFAIESLEDKRYIGWCGYMNRSTSNGTVEVGIAIYDKKLWGKGYGTDALRVLIKFLFDELNVRKIMLNVYDYNERGISSYKKIGFVEEGRLRKQVYRGGKYHDSIIMGLFREEFVDEK